MAHWKKKDEHENVRGSGQPQRRVPGGKRHRITKKGGGEKNVGGEWGGHKKAVKRHSPDKTETGGTRNEGRLARGGTRDGENNWVKKRPGNVTAAGGEQGGD